MTFALYFFLAWILSLFLYFYRSKLPFGPATFLFLLGCLVHSQIFSLIPINFHGIKLTQNQETYLAFLIWRSLISPLLLVTFFKLFYFQTDRLGNLFFTAGLFALVQVLLEKISELLNIYSFQWWNLYWGFLYYFISFLLFSMLTFWFIRMGEQDYVG